MTMTPQPGLQVVWLKKDLRLTDHAPLQEASQWGPCLCLYAFEPTLMAVPTYDASHAQFVLDSLGELISGLNNRGSALWVAVGNMPLVLNQLQALQPIATLWSHEETGDDASYARDKAVGQWTVENNIPWVEYPQTGVIRRLKTRDAWAGQWRKRMDKPLILTPPVFQPLPTGLSQRLPLNTLPTLKSLDLPPSLKQAQPGGEAQAHTCLQDFLTRRGKTYQKAMSSPVSGWEACSRLSPYITWGNISIKQVRHATLAQLALLSAPDKTDADRTLWLRALRSFEKRLYWHCHFMQKLEDEPGIEFHNVNRAFDGLRENDFNDTLFTAWCEGQTGYPMIDACMRCLHQTGWINFRMRAMLVSFAAYQLWLHWSRPAAFLARHFLDYEPGIHYSQFQMQSGVTGINSIRIYSPLKQGRDQDPDGQFIRQYVPELADLPSTYIHQPDCLPPLLGLSYNFVPGRNYPLPIVPPQEAYQQAKDRIYTWSGQPAVKLAAQAVYQKHGSRNRNDRR